MISVPSLALADARRITEEALAAAEAMGLRVAVAVLDAGAHPVLLTRMDGTQLAATDVAVAKARAAALFRRPTKAFEELARDAGRPAVLMLPSAVPNALAVEGGLPVWAQEPGEHGPLLIGSVGVSGARSDEDATIAEQALNAYWTSAGA